MSTSPDYRAWVEVLPEFAQFNQQVQAGVVGGLAGAGSSGAAAMGGGLVAGIGKFALPLAGAIAALGIGSAVTNQIQQGIDAGIAYVKSAVSVGSDYNESLNAISVAYGEFASEIDRLSQSSALDLGLSRLDFNAIATQFSSFARTIRQDNPVGFIEDLSQRGADFASVYNLEVSEALRLFQSGLAGETEPLRRFGIDLSAATVASYAYANGIAEQGRQLTEAQRQQAAYGALMEQTAMVQGDFANTSDQLANSQRILQAQFQDAQAELGMALLPVLQEVMAFVREELMPVWVDLNRELGPALKSALEESWPTIKELAERVLPLIPPAIEWVIASIRWFIETIDGNLRMLNIWTGALNDIFALLKGDISINEFVANFVARVSEWREVVDARIAEVKQAFVQFGTDIAGVIYAIGVNLYRSGRAMMQQFIDGIRAMLKPLSDVMNNVMNFVGGFFPSSPAERGPFSGSGWSRILQSGAAIMDAFEAGLRPVEVPLTASLAALPGTRVQSADSMVAPDGTPIRRDPGPIKLDDESIQKLADAIFTRGRLQSRMGAV